MRNLWTKWDIHRWQKIMKNTSSWGIFQPGAWELGNLWSRGKASPGPVEDLEGSGFSDQSSVGIALASKMAQIGLWGEWSIRTYLDMIKHKLKQVAQLPRDRSSPRCELWSPWDPWGSQGHIELLRTAPHCGEIRSSSTGPLCGVAEVILQDTARWQQFEVLGFKAQPQVIATCWWFPPTLAHSGTHHDWANTTLCFQKI